MGRNKDIASYYNIDEKYIEELYLCQVELLKLQKHIAEQNQRLLIICEGRDTAGKGRAIFRFTQFLNPQYYRVVALTKPTKMEKGQWYFQRYIVRLPNPGEMVFFDRSWYNRAVVEPVMQFCTAEEHDIFMDQVVHVERMLVETGMQIIKFWFSIATPETQEERIQRRLNSQLVQWKVSPVDLAATEKWEDFTRYKEKMFEVTGTPLNPWVNIRCDIREESRIQAMRYVLAQFDYPDKSDEVAAPETDKVVIFR